METKVRHTSKYCDILQINAYKTFTPAPGTLILAFIGVYLGYATLGKIVKKMIQALE